MPGCGNTWAKSCARVRGACSALSACPAKTIRARAVRTAHLFAPVAESCQRGSALAARSAVDTTMGLASSTVMVAESCQRERLR